MRTASERKMNTLTKDEVKYIVFLNEADAAADGIGRRQGIVRRTFMSGKEAGITVSCRQGIIRWLPEMREAEFRKSNIWGSIYYCPLPEIKSRRM